jgi:glycosyltransferase involved in cell wall biosynthesis
MGSRIWYLLDGEKMRVAIISSVDESCGNASFTDHLVRSLNAHGVAAKAIGLNLHYTQSVDKNMRKIADNQIKKIVESLKDYDGVNLQFEQQLFGAAAKDILKRLNLLLNSGIKTTITIHATRLFPLNSITTRSIIKKIFNFKIRSAVFDFGKLQADKRVLKLNRAIIRTCVNANVDIIVHTKKSAEAIENFFQYKRVHVHPLKFTDPGRVLQNQIPINDLLGLKPDTKTIGIFGFISTYKGGITAIEALKYLPSNYHLIIVGRQHPQTIKDYEKINPYLKTLLEMIKKHSLLSRVHFVNELSDEELLKWAASIDFAWLPYMEVGQDGSGIASIFFDLAQRVIASNSKSFDELIRLIPQYKCERFDIGNYFELAGKTLNYQEKRDLQGNLKYSCNSQTNLYINLFS